MNEMYIWMKKWEKNNGCISDSSKDFCSGRWIAGCSEGLLVWNRDVGSSGYAIILGG